MPLSAEPVGALSQVRHQGAGRPCRADRVAPGVSSAGCRGLGEPGFVSSRFQPRARTSPRRAHGPAYRHRRLAARSWARSGRSAVGVQGGHGHGRAAGELARERVQRLHDVRVGRRGGLDDALHVRGAGCISCRCAAKIRALARGSAAVVGGWSTPRARMCWPLWLPPCRQLTWTDEVRHVDDLDRRRAGRARRVLRSGWLPASSRCRPPRRSRDDRAGMAAAVLGSWGPEG